MVNCKYCKGYIWVRSNKKQTPKLFYFFTTFVVGIGAHYMNTLYWIQDRLALLGVLTWCEEHLDCLEFLQAFVSGSSSGNIRVPFGFDRRQCARLSGSFLYTVRSQRCCSVVPSIFPVIFNGFRYRANSSASPVLLQCLQTQALWLYGFPFFPDIAMVKFNEVFTSQTQLVLPFELLRLILLLGNRVVVVFLDRWSRSACLLRTSRTAVVAIIHRIRFIILFHTGRPCWFGLTDHRFAPSRQESSFNQVCHGKMK